MRPFRRPPLTCIGIDHLDFLWCVAQSGESRSLQKDMEVAQVTVSSTAQERQRKAVLLVGRHQAPLIPVPVLILRATHRQQHGAAWMEYPKEVRQCSLQMWEKEIGEAAEH